MKSVIAEKYAVMAKGNVMSKSTVALVIENSTEPSKLLVEKVEKGDLGLRQARASRNGLRKKSQRPERT